MDIFGDWVMPMIPFSVAFLKMWRERVVDCSVYPFIFKMSHQELSLFTQYWELVKNMRIKIRYDRKFYIYVVNSFDIFFRNMFASVIVFLKML